MSDQIEIRMDYFDFEMILEREDCQGMCRGHLDSFRDVLKWIESGYITRGFSFSAEKWSELEKAIETQRKKP